MFIVLCISLSNQKCEILPTLINLHPNEYSQVYSQELHYYPFAVKLDKCVGSCNTKDISCECKCKFDGRKCTADQW